MHAKAVNAGRKKKQINTTKKNSNNKTKDKA